MLPIHEEITTLYMPDGARVFKSVEMQDGKIVIWAITDQIKKPKLRSFFIVETGKPMPFQVEDLKRDGMVARRIGSVKTGFPLKNLSGEMISWGEGDNFIWHVFEVVTEEFYDDAYNNEVIL